MLFGWLTSVSSDSSAQQSVKINPGGGGGGGGPLFIVDSTVTDNCDIIYFIVTDNKGLSFTFCFVGHVTSNLTNRSDVYNTYC